MGPLTFTARDLNRQPAKVLNAVRKFGTAEVLTRNGETFVVSLKSAKKRKKAKMPDFDDLYRRLREAGNVPPPASEYERINRIIAGEE
ncbi:MAG: hypothetical protein M3463_09375 [Verrucomicrobiota bacterium]|nr:hypothetical protein [Verrucomicrobiota bacterium]